MSAQVRSIRDWHAYMYEATSKEHAKELLRGAATDREIHAHVSVLRSMYDALFATREQMEARLTEEHGQYQSAAISR